MNYQLISANSVIAKIENDFSIDYADWIPRVGIWLNDALSHMEIVTAYEEQSFPLEVDDYHVELPNVSIVDIKRILGISYNDEWLIRLNVIKPIRQPSIRLFNQSRETYNVKNGYITTSFKSGSIILYVDVPAIEYDELRQIYLPKIPNNDNIVLALEWYLLYCILRRGHKHPVYSLDSSNPITNPYLMWEKYRKLGKNSLCKFDPEERAEITRLLTTLFTSNKIHQGNIEDF